MGHFRSAPINGHRQTAPACPGGANFGSERTHSITSSARASSEGAMVSPTSPDMRVTYLDATEHPGTVQEYKIMSAPGIRYINGELAYTGSVSDTVQPRLDMTREFSPNAIRISSRSSSTKGLASSSHLRFQCRSLGSATADIFKRSRAICTRPMI